MRVSIFGASCSPFTCQEIKNRNALEFQDEFPEAVKAVLKRHYMDDYLDSKHSEEDSIKLIEEVIEVHQRGNFKIRNWSCSNAKVLE